MSPAFLALLVALTATNLADQMTLATLTLAAAGAGSRVTSLLVAVQSLAWLLVSLPAGALADRISRLTLLRLGAGLSLAGAILSFVFVIAKGGAWTGLWPALIGVAIFTGSAGLVLLSLSAFALVPLVLPAGELPRGNARIELGRAVMSLAAPLIAGFFVARAFPLAGLGLAIIASAIALFAVHRLPDLHPPRPQSQPMLAAIRDGAHFVMAETHLRGIAICAIFWNAAFFGVLAIFSVYAREVLALSADATGASWAAYGAGAMLGALVAARALSTMPPGAIFVFGPASSALGAIVLASGRGEMATLAAAIGFFSFGFGPMLWLIAQTSLRQLITPAETMGRVGATITAANYGVRPIGALGTGWIAAEQGAAAAMWVPAALFLASAIAILFSPLPALKAMPEAASSAG